MDAWNFYNENATGFVKDFGLMPGLLAARGQEGPEAELFLLKLSTIHAGVHEAVNKRTARAADPTLLEGDL